MPKYLLSYHGGEFPPELADEVDRNWARWADPLGSVFIDRGGPLHASKTIGKGGLVSKTGNS